MRLFSAKGEKSTRFERVFFVGVLVVAAAFITPGISETVQMNRLFAQADPTLLSRCKASSDYAAWRFWDSKVQAYATCIVDAKDPAVQNAAGKYLLKGQQGEFTVEPPPSIAAGSPSAIEDKAPKSP